MNMHIGKLRTHLQGGARQDRKWGSPRRTGAVQASSQALRIYMTSIFFSMPETMCDFLKNDEKKAKDGNEMKKEK